MFSVKCEELKINHRTSFLVVTMPYACWFLWLAYYIEDFKWHLHFQFGVAFWRVVLREVYFEGPNRVWRALKTSILNTDREPQGLLFELLGMASIHHTWAAVKIISSSCASCNLAAPISLYPPCCQFTTSWISGLFSLCRIFKMIGPTLELIA